MAVQKIEVDVFLAKARHAPVLDVRSPSEYGHAHIPGAYSFPLFSDEERKRVGTAYKQVSRETAIKIGLDFFGPKMRTIVEKAENLLHSFHQIPEGGNCEHRTLLVHCWRGGMRSAAIAWLLDLYGFKIYTLIGGYKKYRHWVIDTYSTVFPLHVLGGYTGSGKTYVLRQLKQRDEPVIDLEQLAGHKGSAFGNIGMPVQPTQEHFENLLCNALNEVGVRPRIPYTGRPIWMEDESQRIGTVNIPQPFWLLMRSAPVYFLDIPFEQRLGHIVSEYGSLDREGLRNAVTRISRRLGGLETKTVLEKLEQGDIPAAFTLLLKYYDKWYLKGLHNRTALEELLHTIPSEEVSAEVNSFRLLEKIKK